VSSVIATELARIGRPADIVTSVGVDIAELPSTVARSTPGRILSARREAPVYRRPLVRAAAAALAEIQLVESDRWPRAQLLMEMARAEVVVSAALTDGAPATVMEALCLGAHVVASGGHTVEGWLREVGGTYGEPTNAHEMRALLERGLARARAETLEQRAQRATRARELFDREKTVGPVLGWLERATMQNAKDSRTP
jgi:hypothetical protein